MSFVLSAAEQITDELDDIIKDVCPSAGRRSMYGGIVFEKEGGNHSTMICGHFVYKKHVSLEFSQGYKLNDPDGLLEGGGKFRRHIKLIKPTDIAEKSVRLFLEQAFALAD